LGFFAGKPPGKNTEALSTPNADEREILFAEIRKTKRKGRELTRRERARMKEELLKKDSEGESLKPFSITLPNPRSGKI